MNLPQDHMPLQQCIDILEWNIGDEKDIPVEWQNGAHVVQATRIAIEILKGRLLLAERLNEMKEDWNKIIECWNKIGEKYIVQFSDKTNV